MRCDCTQLPLNPPLVHTHMPHTYPHALVADWEREPAPVPPPPPLTEGTRGQLLSAAGSTSRAQIASRASHRAAMAQQRRLQVLSSLRASPLFLRLCPPPPPPPELPAALVAVDQRRLQANRHQLQTTGRRFSRNPLYTLWGRGG